MSAARVYRFFTALVYNSEPEKSSTPSITDGDIEEPIRKADSFIFVSDPLLFPSPLVNIQTGPVIFTVTLLDIGIAKFISPHASSSLDLTSA